MEEVFTTRNKKHVKIKTICLILLSALAVLAGAFLIWTAFYYHADNTAREVLQSDSSIETSGNLIILPAEDSKAEFIFYPGAKVEAISYLPLLEKIRSYADITRVLVKMPRNMAFLNMNAADSVIGKYPEIKTWYIGGHSLGGAMASSYASKNQDRVSGLILLGAYVYGDYPPEKALTVYGTLNADLEKKIDYTDNIVKIEGGNHAQFGNYGPQKGDLPATITAEEQQNITAEAVAEFLRR